MPQRMDTCRLYDSGTILRLLKDLRYRAYCDMGVFLSAFEQPFLRAIVPPVVSQAIKGGLRQESVTVLAPFALLYPHHHTFAVDIGHFQT